MARHHMFTGMFVITSIYLLVIYQFPTASSAAVNNVEAHRPRPRGIGRFASRYSLPKPEVFNDFIADDDDLFELSKRQASDDYGHLRFGKRAEEQFDDYGHMRFGR